MRHTQQRSEFSTIARQDVSKEAADHAQLDDFLRVQPHETDSDSDLEAPKDRETGLRDIHLEDMRQDSQTMMMEIYGIPESWLSLLSQTTRLANVIEIIDASKGQVSRQFQASIQRKTTRLEHMICSFAFNREWLQSMSSSRTTAPSHDGHQHNSANESMLQAMSSALVIFFYRRIRKVHPCILQGHVNDVIDALKSFDRALGENSMTGPGTPWPCFIAGCEAMQTASQDWLLNWMERASGLLASDGVRDALDIMREVWKRRDAANATTAHGRINRNNGDQSQKRTELECTWVDILCERKSWLMLF